MMAEKARLFGADDIRCQIIASAHPKQAKDLGRQVIGFKNDIWNARRFDIVCEGNRAKFIAMAGFEPTWFRANESTG